MGLEVQGTRRTCGASVHTLKHTIAGPGTEGVKVHQVTNQGDIQHFSDLLEIIIFVHQLEGLRRVVEALVGPIGEIVRSVGNESLPAVAVAEKRVGLNTNCWRLAQRGTDRVDRTGGSPFVLATINRIEAPVWT